MHGHLILNEKIYYNRHGELGTHELIVNQSRVPTWGLW